MANKLLKPDEVRAEIRKVVDELPDLTEEERSEFVKACCALLGLRLIEGRQDPQDLAE